MHAQVYGIYKVISNFKAKCEQVSYEDDTRRRRNPVECIQHRILYDVWRTQRPTC